jgi:hypothetical protein
MSLARLGRHPGMRDEAHDLLTPICDWFTEGCSTICGLTNNSVLAVPTTLRTSAAG